jgi:hypothetical protein
MSTKKSVYEAIMKIVVRIRDVVALAKRFEQSPALAMQEVVTEMRAGVRDVLERVMAAEIELFLGRDEEASNKRNGFVSRAYGIKGVGTLKLRVPRDREGRFSSNVVPAYRRYDAATEKDVAILNLAGLSTRMLAHLSGSVLGIRVSAKEVSNALHTIIPAAKAFLSRPLGERKWMYLYVDGTNFRVRRSTVGIEPTLVVLGVDETGRKSVLSMIQGDKDSRAAWEAVFVDLKERGLDGSCIRAGIHGRLARTRRRISRSVPQGEGFALLGAQGAKRDAARAASISVRVSNRVERRRVRRESRRGTRCVREVEDDVEQRRQRRRREDGARHRSAARTLRIPSRALGSFAHDESDRTREQGIQATLQGDGGREPGWPQAAARL